MLVHKHLVKVVPITLILLLFLLFQMHTSHASICRHKKHLLCSRWLQNLLKRIYVCKFSSLSLSKLLCDLRSSGLSAFFFLFLVVLKPLTEPLDEEILLILWHLNNLINHLNFRLVINYCFLRVFTSNILLIHQVLNGIWERTLVQDEGVGLLLNDVRIQ